MEKLKEISMIKNDGGMYLGILLQKPKDYKGGKISLDTLNQKFVEKCVNADKHMENFINKKIRFTKEYPFIKEI